MAKWSASILRFTAVPADSWALSFAIPIDVATDISNQLIATGKVSRGRIGVLIQEVTKELAESFGLPKACGALVASVQKGSPAEKAGMEARDVILKFDGKPVTAQAICRVLSAPPSRDEGAGAGLA